jgi:hypothetical protein
MPRSHDAVYQFGHNLARHFTGFFDNLIQRNRHELTVAHELSFDNVNLVRTFSLVAGRNSFFSNQNELYRSLFWDASALGEDFGRLLCRCAERGNRAEFLPCRPCRRLEIC